jgi:hypothetical protein
MLFSEAGYFSKVTIEGTTFEAEESCTNKKMAEQCAARAGLVGMGIKDPEAVATRLLQKYVNAALVSFLFR